MRRIAFAVVMASCGFSTLGKAQGMLPPGAVVKDAGRRRGLNTKMFERVEPQFAWKAVEAAYKKAHAEPTFISRSDYKMAYVVSPAPKKIANVKLQDAFDCGGDKKAPHAANIDLEVTVTSVVNGLPEGSEVVTIATAVPVGSLPTGEVPTCFSKGRLEQKFEPDIKIGRVVVVTRSTRVAR